MGLEQRAAGRLWLIDVLSPSAWLSAVESRPGPVCPRKMIICALHNTLHRSGATRFQRAGWGYVGANSICAAGAPHPTSVSWCTHVADRYRDYYVRCTFRRNVYVGSYLIICTRHCFDCFDNCRRHSALDASGCIFGCLYDEFCLKQK